MATPSQKRQATPADVKALQAEQAKALQDNPLWREALDKIEAEFEREWRDSAYEDRELRERAYHMVHATRRLRVIVAEYVNTQRLDQARIAAATGRQKR